jgi:hypothetical protein
MAVKAKIEPDIIEVDDDDAAALMEEARAKLAAKEEENARLREQLNGKGRGLRWFFAQIWSYHQFRMLATALVVAAWLAASRNNIGAGNLAYALVALFLFCKWAEVVYRDLRAGQLVLKCMAAVFGAVGICAALVDGNNPGAAFAVLAFTALLVMSQATEKLAESDMALVRFVRDWF